MNYIKIEKQGKRCSEYKKPSHMQWNYSMYIFSFYIIFSLFIFSSRCAFRCLAKYNEYTKHRISVCSLLVCVCVWKVSDSRAAVCFPGTTHYYYNFNTARFHVVEIKQFFMVLSCCTSVLTVKRTERVSEWDGRKKRKQAAKRKYHRNGANYFEFSSH